MIINVQFPDKYSRPHSQNGQDLSHTVAKKKRVVSHCYLKKIPDLKQTIVLVLINFCQTYCLDLI